MTIEAPTDTERLLAEGPLRKSNKATPKQNKIYKNKAKRTPVNRTAAMVVTGTDGLAPGRGNVSCSACGEPVKETEMKEHLRKKHHQNRAGFAHSVILGCRGRAKYVRDRRSPP